MNPFYVSPLAAAGAVVAALLIGATGGYGYKAYRVEMRDTAAEAKQDAVAAPVSAASEAIDQSAGKRRDAAIETAKQRTVYVTRLIEKAANENPAPADCRLPDRLRDELNRDLAADRPEPADPLQ